MVAENLLSMQRALGVIPNTKKKKLNTLWKQGNSYFSLKCEMAIMK